MSILSMGNALVRGALHDSSNTGRWLWMRRDKKSLATDNRVRVDAGQPITSRKPRVIAARPVRSASR